MLGLQNPIWILRVMCYCFSIKWFMNPIFFFFCNTYLTLLFALFLVELSFVLLFCCFLVKTFFLWNFCSFCFWIMQWYWELLFFFWSFFFMNLCTDCCKCIEFSSKFYVQTIITLAFVSVSFSCVGVYAFGFDSLCHGQWTVFVL